MTSKLVLVLNCGSSSLKFAILDAETGDERLSGLAECFYLPEARIKWKLDGEKGNAELGAGAAHQQALDFIVTSLLNPNPELLQGLVAVGHRVVHGGEQFTHSVLIDETVIKGIEDCASLAPLHNPAHLVGIASARKSFPALPQVAVFDTAFHQTMPEQAYLYAIPYRLYREHGIRRYGMHGTSHYFIAQESARLLDKPVSELNIISCHLGNGASVCAIKNGESVDTSMGLTPLEGLVMGTRSGDIDPAIIFHLHDVLGYSTDRINTLLTKESGLLGLTENTSDCRFAEDNYHSLPEAKRALDIFCYRLAKYIAGYTCALDGRLDGIVFTGGIGENSALVRELTLSYLGLLGFKLDADANLAARFGKAGRITAEGSTPAWVLPTNEEWVIAQDALALSRQQ
ncbi:acetate kinase [Zobellella denitrificans]|jgi:acetate kinase|uniref:Acetate kinase n=1 Tax=Zobellella denitrificans TaxID=347534 RepID=A0A231MVJ9_9GAMM|nr:acetate kinase [Zobellella denitrificans]ATG73097.1 acetate kinase [Zobellella denitrificans]OXS14241.1 acetate kinase [Zobellella denitrificans]